MDIADERKEIHSKMAHQKVRILRRQIGSDIRSIEDH